MVTDDDLTALVPIMDMMPELSGEQYADVRQWDTEILAADVAYEAYTGERLAKIRDALKPVHGLWTAYLRARGIPEATARDRIRRAEGRYKPYVATKATDTVAFPEAIDTVAVPRDELRRLEHIETQWERSQTIGYHAMPEDIGWPEEPEPDYQPPVRPAPASAPARALPVVPAKAPETFSIEQWNALDPEAQAKIIATGRANSLASLNAQNTDSIEWARWSWNPVTGCLHNCPYCYARDIANRFYEQKFVPTFQPQRLGAPFHQKVPAQAEAELGYRNIFTCSMADLFGKWVPAGWIEAVLDVVRDNPQWNFLFLTKFPVRLAEFTFPDNAWIGTTVDCQARVKNAERSFARVRGGVKWLSIEPMLEPLKFSSLDMFNWLVIGGASASSQTPAWSPPRQWVDDLEAAARAASCMIYEKTNLSVRLREYPGWQREIPQLPDALAYLPSIEQD